MEYLAQVNGLCKRYPDFFLDHVTFQIPAGCIIGMIGENGAGKTTTLKAILGVIQPDEGDVQLLGQPPSPDSFHHIAVVWENGYFDDNLTPHKINHVMAGIHPTWDDAVFHQYLKRFQLPEKKKIKDFSLGMQRKLNLATALARHPKLLLMDEATSGLDPVVRGELLDLFLEFIQDDEHSIVLSTHITSDLEKIADQILYIHQGKLLFQRNKDELLEDMAIVRAPAAQLEQLPSDLILAQQKNAFGSAALIQHPELVRHLLPEAVYDRAALEDIMQFITGRDCT